MPTLNASKAYGSAIGPLGFPMPERLAKAADDAIKSLPKDVREHFHSNVIGADGKRHAVDGYARFQTVAKAMDLVDGERADISVVTSDAVDRDQEVVAADGLDWSQFTKNPVVTLFHNYAALPVGKALWVKAGTTSEGNACWKAKTLYMPRPADFTGDEWMPDTVWAFVQAGYLRGKSIGFIPMGYREITPDDVRANPDYAEAHWIIDKAMILEYAVCPVQANPDALVEQVAKMKAKGVRSGELVDALGIIIPDSLPAIDEVAPDVKTIKETAPAEIIRTAESPESPDAKAAETTAVEPKPVIRSFVRAETLAAAKTGAAKQLSGNLKKQLAEAVEDEIHRMMGRV